MQNNLPANVNRQPSYEAGQPVIPETLPAVQNGLPGLDGYSVVSLQLREATITATNDPNAFGAGSGSRAQANPSPYAHQPYFGGQPPQITSRQQPAKKQKLTGKDMAAWICVAQLGVIIWLMAAPNNEKTLQGELKTSLLGGASQLGVLFNQATLNSLSALNVPALETGKTNGKAKNGSKAVTAKKNNSTRRASGKRGAVPPPPPEVAAGKFFIPPPPVAYALPVGAGAVAASTLPVQHNTQNAPVPATQRTKQAKTEIAAQTSETQEATQSINAHAVVAASTAAAQTASASAEPAPGIPALSPELTKTYSWREAMGSAGIADPAPITQAAPSPATVEPIRTVMSGNRKRIITDR